MPLTAAPPSLRKAPCAQKVLGLSQMIWQNIWGTSSVGTRMGSVHFNWILCIFFSLTDFQMWGKLLLKMKEISIFSQLNSYTRVRKMFATCFCTLEYITFHRGKPTKEASGWFLHTTRYLVLWLSFSDHECLHVLRNHTAFPSSLEEEGKCLCYNINLYFSWKKPSELRLYKWQMCVKRAKSCHEPVTFVTLVSAGCVWGGSHMGSCVLRGSNFPWHPGTTRHNTDAFTFCSFTWTFYNL